MQIKTHVGSGSNLSEWRTEKGVTFLELLVTIAIIGILAAIAVPNYGDYVERQRLVGATEAVYGQLLLAKRASISNNRDVHFVAKNAETADWCITIAESASDVGANCSGGFVVSSFANPSIVLESLDSYPGIQLQSSAALSSISIGFLMPGITVSGAQILTLHSSRIGDVFVDVGESMRMEVCSDDIGSYPDC